MIFKFSPCASETLVPFKLFTQPMNRAEVWHALNYDIELSWKNTPDKFKFVKLVDNSNFPKISLISTTLTATQHARGRMEHYSPRGKPSIRVTSIIPRSVNFAVANGFAFLDVILGQETLVFN